MCVRAQSNSARLFEINSSARWYYEWGSAATKAQRFTKHVLKVYVLERSAYYKEESRPSSAAAVAPAMLRVVALATSETFMVVSYRRAADETRADRRILALLASSARIPPAMLRSSSMESDSDSPMRSFEGTSLLLQHARFADALGKHERLQHHRSSSTSVSHEEADRSPDQLESSRDRAERMWQEKKLWESAHPGTLMQTKHLAILYCVLAHVNAARYVQFLGEWTERFEYYWSRDLQTEAQQYTQQQQQQQQQRYHPYDTSGSPRRIAVTHQRGADTHSTSGGITWDFLSRLAPASSTDQSQSTRQGTAREDEAAAAAAAWQDSQLSSLIQICADAAGWLVFSEDNVALFRRLFADCAPSLLDRDALRAKFVECVQLVWSLIDRFLSTSRGNVQSQQPSYASTQALVEALISTVFKNDALQTIRPVVLTILSSTSMLGLAGFVAQVRSHYLCDSASSPSSSSGGGGGGADARFNGMALTRVLHNIVSPFRGSWRFGGAQPMAVSPHLGRVHAVSLINALDWMRECSAVEIDVEDSQQLVIRSLWSINDGDAGGSPGMNLIADGRARVFSHLPSGLSSMIAIGDRYYGDYQANFLAPDLLELELYAWSDIESEQVANERESGMPGWGSEEKSQHPTVLRWRLQLALERFGRPTATPGAPVLRIDLVADLGLFRDADSLMEPSSLHDRLSEVAEWECVQQVRATYRRVQE